MSEQALDQVNIHEAKTNLSRLVERAEQGEEIVISRSGTPVAKLVPLPRAIHRTGRGSLRGSLVLDDTWDSNDVNAAIADEFDPP